MIKEITYTGLSARPFDNNSTDGDLSIAANCINEKGCIQPVLPPGLAQTISPEDGDIIDGLNIKSEYEVLAIHSCDNVKTYFIKRIANAGTHFENLYTLTKGDANAKLVFVEGFKTVEKIYSVSVIGNIITALTSESKQYILYNEGKYICLGSEPPRLNLQFCLEQVCEPLYKSEENEASGVECNVVPIGYYRPFQNLNMYWGGVIGGQEDRKPWSKFDTPAMEKEYIRSYQVAVENVSSWFDKMFRIGYETVGVSGNYNKAFLYDVEDTQADKSDTNMKDFTKGVFGAYQREMVEYVEKKGYFNQPFLIRYAYKLYNGDYAFFSPPVLMIPSLTVPYCRMLGTDKTYMAHIVFDYIKCQLRYTFDDPIDSDSLKDWENWKTIIKSIDVFISSPIYTWDTDGTIKEQVKHNDWVGNERAYDVCYKDSTGQIVTPPAVDIGGSNRPTRHFSNVIGDYIFDTFGKQWLTDTEYLLENLEDKGVGSFLGTFIGFDKDHYSEDGKEPLEILPTKDNDKYINNPTNWFIPKIPRGRLINNSSDPNPVELWRARDVVKFPKNENFYKDIESVQNFYKIAEIDIPSSDNSFTDGLRLIKLIKKDLSNLEVFEHISDDYYSKSKIISRAQFTFNNRINLLGYKKYCPKVYIEDMMPFNGFNTYGNNSTPRLKLYFDVYYYNSGRQCHYRYSQITNRLLYKNITNNNLSTEWTGLFKYIFFPDPNVFRIDLRYAFYLVTNEMTKEEKAKAELSASYENSIGLASLEMKHSDFLNGSYYFKNFELPLHFGKTIAEGIEDCDYYEEKNKVYTSNVNNPFIFNAVNINTIGHGELYALSSTTQPLSQGQFGLYPLYAFASDGVWALETNSEGGYSAKSILSRDVIIHDADGLATPPLQLENSIIYACDRGIVLLNGSTNQSISEVIDERFPADFLKFQSFEKLTARLNKETLNLISFKQFINGAKYAYDYGNERVWVFNTNHSYAYVFSLKSKLWGIADCNLNAYFSAFPDSFATTRDAKIVDLTNSDVTTAAGFFMTRPFALEMNDVHKTIYSVYQRGLFHNTVNTVLYGSNDLVHWYVIGSSVDHRILNIAGTPYKYFRVASRFNLSGNENILGASIEVNPKMTNKLR